MNDDRIIELEIKAAYQEDLLQVLINIVSRQQQQIERLEMSCKLLNDRIKSVSVGLGGETTHGNGYEIPPHY